jgi:hypothetical protein
MVISHALSQMRARRGDREEGGGDGETVGEGVERGQAGEGGGRGRGGWAGADLLLGMHVRAGCAQVHFDHRYFFSKIFYFV